MMIDDQKTSGFAHLRRSSYLLRILTILRITMPWHLLAITLFLPLLSLAQPTSSNASQPAPGSAEIRGKITITRKTEARDEHLRDPLINRYPTHEGNEAALMMHSAKSVAWKLSERSVVFLESEDLDKGRYPLPARKPLLDQRNLQFHPQVLPILVGTTVDFPNRDNLFHNVFSYSQAKEFDLGRYPKNDSRSVTFDKPGFVRVYCDIHSNMSATILVLQNPFFATPGDDGAYELPNVPAGRYTLALWYDRDVVERRQIEIKPGELIQVDFTF